MRSTRTVALLFIASILLPAGFVFGGGNVGETAPEFPPGSFSDGGRYRVSDFHDKIVVLYFYEAECPRNRASIPDRNRIAASFKDKPIKFIAVSPGNTVSEAQAFITSTHLGMPVYADPLGIMQFRYGQKISLNNIWQFRVIGPDGKIIDYSMEPERLNAAIASVKWKYKGQDWDPRLSTAVELLEWNQYAAGLKALHPYLKSPTKPLAESARKLYDVVKTEAAQWATDAAAAAQAEDVIKAYDLNSRLAACFPDDDLGKNATGELKKLKGSKPIQNELAARKMYEQLYGVMGRATSAQKAQVIGYCQGITQKYPDSPTAKLAADLAHDLVQASVAE